MLADKRLLTLSRVFCYNEVMFRKGENLRNIFGKKTWFKEGHKCSEKIRKKIGLTNSIALKGKHCSPQTEFKKGNIPWMKGRVGNKHPNWKGGISFEPYSIDWTETLKRSIRERDHYICQLCYQYGNCVHHIDYDKKNCNPVNLITLCGSCNVRVNYNREYWISYFT